MYTLAFGLYPIVAIAVCALLTLVYFCVVRLKCPAPWAIGFIFATMAMTTIFSLVSPVQLVEVETAVELLVEPENTSVVPVAIADTAGEPTPQLKMKVQQPIVADIPSVASLLHNASNLLGWLWLHEGEKGGHHKEYLIVNDTIAMILFYHRQEPKAYRAAGYGYSATIREQGDYLQFGDQAPVKYSMTDTDHMTLQISDKNGTTDRAYHRIKMPSDLKRMFFTPLINEH